MAERSDWWPNQWLTWSALPPLLHSCLTLFDLHEYENPLESISDPFNGVGDKFGRRKLGLIAFGVAVVAAGLGSVLYK